MSISFSRRGLRGAALVCAMTILGVVSANPVAATDGVNIGFKTCTKVNCQAVAVAGQVNGLESGVSNPWVGTFLGKRGTPPDGRCIRFDVHSATADLEMTVVAPDGQLFTNDDKGGSTCPSCPRVVVATVNDDGFYTVVINHWAGTSIEAGFNLRVRSYPAGNINCNGPTPPSLTGMSRKQLEAITDKFAAQREPDSR